jgi:SAM-dependent methyltransferase
MMKISSITPVQPYSTIARVYDSILRHVDYHGWYEFILSIMLKFAPRHDLVLELGCGTGRFGAKFANDGYDIVGIDFSIDMLQEAKKREYGNFRVFCSDLKNFYLNKKPGFIFCVHDTMNYLLDPISFRQALRSVKSVMAPDTVFMFDTTTEYNIRENFNGNTTEYELRGVRVFWSNHYNEREKLVYSTLRVKSSGIEETEEHVQRIYSVNETKKFIADEGFELIGIFGDCGYDPPSSDSIMVNFAVRPL